MKKETKKILAEVALVLLVSTYNNEILLGFLWVGLHELSHILVAKKIGCKFHKVEFHFLGAKAELSDIESLKVNEKIIIYLSGALFNIIFAIILYIINIKYPSEIFILNANINIGLAFFNLLPAYPLDGSRILEIILSRYMIFKKVQRLISRISYIIASGFIILPIYNYFIGRRVNLTMFISALIIIYITKIEDKTYMYIAMGNIIKKRKNLVRNKYIENKIISVYYDQGLVNVLALVDKNKFSTFYVLDDEMKIIYILNEDELIEALKLYGNMGILSYVQIKSGKMEV